MVLEPQNKLQDYRMIHTVLPQMGGQMSSTIHNYGVTNLELLQMVRTLTHTQNKLQIYEEASLFINITNDEDVLEQNRTMV